ncbi:MAG: winged helix-turn-helix domain-containing protein, partial [Vicinamibacterales bacterium]
MHSGATYRFGPYTLESTHRRLVQGEERVWLTDRQLDVLMCLVRDAGKIVDREELMKVGWPDTAVTDDSLRKLINSLRDTLGRQPDAPHHYIETRVKKGYEFTAPVVRSLEVASNASLNALLDTCRVFVTGRAALESLDAGRVREALVGFEEAVRADPTSPALRIGLANACFLTFEASRADAHPDSERLQMALQHALEGCRLNPSSGDAWGILALVRHRLGETDEAIAAAHKAILLEPADWLHYLRLAAVSWGQERIRAAHRALALNPELALAHWLAATVFVARALFDRALDELRAGCTLQDAQLGAEGVESSKFKGLGCHWLHGLVLAALGRETEAIDELERELASVNESHVYGRECAANCWYAIGALRLRCDRHD